MTRSAPTDRKRAVVSLALRGRGLLFAALLAAACDSSAPTVPGPSTDAAVADGTHRDQSATTDSISVVDAAPQIDGATPFDAGSQPDGAADAATDGYPPPLDGSPLTDAAPPGAGYLLWQAPGGFVGWGPALELLADGTLRLWKNAFSMTPHQTSGWDHSLTLSPTDTQTLFVLLNSVPYAVLPHPPQAAVDCYPALRFEPCVTCPAHQLSYQAAADLRPEMNAVYAFLDARLQPFGITPPSQYCQFH